MLSKNAMSSYLVKLIELLFWLWLSAILSSLCMCVFLLNIHLIIVSF